MAAQDKPIILGGFSTGPIDSEIYFFGYSEENRKWIDRDILNLSYKFAHFRFNQPDNWINFNDNFELFYTFGNKSDQANFSDLAKYEGVGSSHGKHSWELANYKNGVPNSSNYTNYTRNFDWVAFYTGAYNSVWTANDAYSIGSDLYKYRLQPGNAATGYVQINGENYLTNRIDTLNLAGKLVFGPVADFNASLVHADSGYQQETRHRGSENFFTPTPQTYKANFTLRVPNIVNNEAIIAKLKVVIFSHAYNQEGVLLRDTIKIDTIRNSDFQNNEITFDVTYTLQDYQSNVFRGSTEELPRYLSTSFIVETTGAAEVMVKQIEVFDYEVWEEHMGDPSKLVRADSNITGYLNELNDLSSSYTGFFEKVKYLQSVDEPHTFDLFNASKFVRETLEQSTLSNKPKLFTHYYPEYNGMRGRESAFYRYFKVVKPDPIVFYTYYHSDDNSAVSSMWRCRTMDEYLHQMKNAEGDIYPDSTRFQYIINIWGQEDIDWRLPSDIELRSTVFAVLAYGANVIYYEPVFTYAGIESLINEDESLTPLGIYVRDYINPRILGPLGQKLNNSRYTGRTLAHYNVTGPFGGRSGNPGPFSDFYPAVESGGSVDFIELIGYPQYPHILVAGCFEDWKYPEIKYFLLNNIAGYDLSEEAPQVKLKKFNGSYSNYSLYDVENTISISTYDLTTALTTELRPIGEGDAILYGFGPTAMLGGTLQVTEAIGVQTTLFFKELTIPSGKNLTISNKYYINKNITIEGTGGLFTTGSGLLYLQNGAEISSSNWSSSLFKSESGGKVKLIWSDYTIVDSIAVVEEYKIYRKKGGNDFLLIATVSPTTFEYVDTETEIYTGSLATGVAQVQYYIKPVVSDPGPASNTVAYWYYAGLLDKEGNPIPEKSYTFTLHQNYPNPFNASTKIMYSVDKPGRITLRIYDVLGRLQAEAVNGFHQPGEYDVNFNTGNMASGIYIYELLNEDMKREVRKFVLAR